MTRERIAELRAAGDERGGSEIDDSTVHSADFCYAAVDGLKWGELRELLDVWESDDRRVG